MERGVYFDAWYPRQHCYHPSLPARRLKMIEDLEQYHATTLVWSALGGGSISLPYLEQEAWGPIDARFRFYGYLNDAEFIYECQKRGIKVFGIVFEVQGWEFPAELSDDEGELLSLNELRSTGKEGWLGLREFSQDRYPHLWKPFKHYFPEGLRNSEGEEVRDLLEECASRDIYGAALHSTWVECPDRKHYAYLMDRNNPVWREYLKAVIRIQIDAGVAGVELDEADLPMFATGYGGCFCKDCMRLFREYLKELPKDRLPPELDGVDLTTFHYGSWLLDQGYDFKANRESTPLYWEYLRFQRKTVTKYFGELADYVKEYAASVGREVLVSGNFYAFNAHFHAMAKKADILITEMNATSYRQPAWYRYAAGFAGRKATIVVENPYGGCPPELLEKLKEGKGYDLFRMMHYEAAALGLNMGVPYGAWMGSVIEDSFWPPHHLVVEVQNFLARYEDLLYSVNSFAETAVVYSVESSYRFAEAYGTGTNFPFWEACNVLVNAKQPFDVVVFGDNELGEGEVSGDVFSQYRTVVLPQCTDLSLSQVSALEAFLGSGGHVRAIGEFATQVGEGVQAELFSHPRVLRGSSLQLSDLADGPQIVIEPIVDCYLHVQRVGDRAAAVHLIRYDYEERIDAVPTLERLSLGVRLARPFRSMKVFSPCGTPTGKLSYVRELREIHRIELENVPLYTVVLLEC